MEVRHDDIPESVDGGVVRPGELVQLRAPGPELGDELAAGLEDVEARGLVVHHDQLPGRSHRHPLGPEQPRAAELAEELSTGLVDADPFVVVVADRHAAVPEHGDPGWSLELARGPAPCPPPRQELPRTAEHLHTTMTLIKRDE